MIKNINQKQKAIRELLHADISDIKDLMRVKRIIAKKYGLDIFSNAEILKEIDKLDVKRPVAYFKRLLRKRAIRTMSGIAPVAVLTKPYPCPGKCAYCPTEKNVPQSYLSNEPAVMRAIRCGYDPYAQAQDRLRALIANGHEPAKIELIVIGGTWSYLPEKYKYWYVLNCYKAANDFEKNLKFKSISKKLDKIFNFQFPISKQFSIIKSQLIEEQKKNEKAKYKIIGLTLETRPDYINEKELWQMRELGCTRVELGVQHLDDKILKLNRRGHDVSAVAEATMLLKNFGFKVTYHIMPGLPGATPAKDLKMYRQLFTDERFQPDQIKFYPCVVTKGSLLYRWWLEGRYKPYSDKQLRKLIIKCKKTTPEYVRIIRLIRDIPGESIMAGNLATNLRQVLKDEGAECCCIRCREIKDYQLSIINYQLRITNYYASGGQEYFIQAVTKDDKYLLGFCRLRLDHATRSTQHTTHNTQQLNNSISPISQSSQKSQTSQQSQTPQTALIRELHVYGELVPVGGEKKVQHRGLGKILLKQAEKIALENNYSKISVISGVGVRGYYRKLGYRLKNTYMERDLK